MTTPSKIASHHNEKRKALAKALSAAEAKPLRHLLTTALINTDLCMAVYDDYASAFPKLEGFLAAHRADLLDLAEADLQLRSTIEPSTHTAADAARGIDRLSPEARSAFLSGVELDALLRRYFAQQAAALTDALGHLYTEEEETVLLGAIRHLLEFLVGITPYGYVVDGLQRIQALFNARIAALRTADAYLHSLELYQLATLYWCLAAQFATDVLINLDDPAKASIDIAEHELVARMETFGSSLVSPTIATGLH